MTRLVNAAFVLAILIHASFVYGLERESRLADDRLAKIRDRIAEERENVRRLRAEWSGLNAPARLERLAKKYLDYRSGRTPQVIELTEVTKRVPGLPPGTNVRDPITSMLAGETDAATADVSTGRIDPDPIGDFLEGLR